MAFNRDAKFSEPIDKFVLMFGRVCVEDFFEILLCCGNGNGQAAQKLLRGLYERAVTLRYLREHPEEIEDFLDFYHVTQRKLMIACQNTMGAETFPAEMAADTGHALSSMSARPKANRYRPSRKSRAMLDTTQRG
jgi:hypothetical protein